jgi:hypothetical protein
MWSVQRREYKKDMGEIPFPEDQDISRTKKPG